MLSAAGQIPSAAWISTARWVTPTPFPHLVGQWQPYAANDFGCWATSPKDAGRRPQRLGAPGVASGQNLPVSSDRRPWGTFEVLSEDLTHKVKRLTVDPGQRLSYQRHAHRSEHWFVVAGSGTVTLDGAATAVRAGVSIDVPRGMAHRVENTGSDPLVFIEVQHGTSFAEDDIERLEDDYGRTPV